MYLSENIYDSGLIEEITRLTDATPFVYSNKARVARLNNALDRYGFLAVNAASRGGFDDSGYSISRLSETRTNELLNRPSLRWGNLNKVNRLRSYRK